MIDPRLIQAAEIVNLAATQGMDLELDDVVQLVIREFRRDKDRQWRRNNPIGTAARIGTTLARWTGLDVGDCQAAAAAGRGDDLATVVVDAILEFGKRHQSAGPRTTRRQGAA